jgi:SAM-dependent methyltransferase
LKPSTPTEIRWLAKRDLQRAIAEGVRRAARAGGTVVDLGCGERPYQALFEQANMRYVGCDLDGSADVLIQPGSPIPLPSGSAALVTSFQVLEHVADVGQYLSECHRLLDANGKLLLSTHGVWPYHPHPGDYHRWTRQGLVLLLEQNQFVIERTHALLGPLTWSLLIQGLAVNELGKRLHLPGVFSKAVNLALNAAMLAAEAATPSQVRWDNAAIYVMECRRANTKPATRWPAPAAIPSPRAKARSAPNPR